MFSLICTRINGWVNNCEAGDLRHHRAHCDVIVVKTTIDIDCWKESPGFQSHQWYDGVMTWKRFPHYSLQWRHNGHISVSNHQPHDCWLNRLFRRRSKKTLKLRVTGHCAGNSPVNSPHKGPITRKMFPFDDVSWFLCEGGMLLTSGFPSLRDSKAELGCFPYKRSICRCFETQYCSFDIIFMWLVLHYMRYIHWGHGHWWTKNTHR